MAQTSTTSQAGRKPKTRLNIIMEFACALALLGFSGLVFAGTADLPPPVFEPIGSAALPRILAGALAVLSVSIAVRAFRALRGNGAAAAAQSEPEADSVSTDLSKGEKGQFDMAVAVLMATFLFVALMDFGLLPFHLAAFLFLVLIGFLMAHQRVRALARVIPYALLLAGVSWFVFVKLFYIDLP